MVKNNLVACVIGSTVSLSLTSCAYFLYIRFLNNSIYNNNTYTG